MEAENGLLVLLVFVHWDALRSRVEDTRGRWLLGQAASATHPHQHEAGEKVGPKEGETCARDLISRSLKETGVRAFSSCP